VTSRVHYIHNTLLHDHYSMGLYCFVLKDGVGAFPTPFLFGLPDIFDAALFRRFLFSLGFGGEL